MAVLALIEPLDLSLGERVVLRLSSDASVAATSHGGEAWWPAIPTPPTLGIDLFDGDFTSPVDVSTGQMGIRMDVVNELSGSVRDFNWADAPVQLFDLRDGLAFSLFTGKVTRFAMEDLLLQVTMAVDTEPFEVDVLASEYAGTTGIEGGDDIKDRVKPWVFGRALNVEPVLIDTIDNVYQVSGYGPIEAINAVYERGASFGPAEGDYADYDALVAAGITEGEWATCLAQGLFRLGAPQAGVITCDVDGDNGGGFLRRTGAILLRIAEVLGIDDTLIDRDSLEELDRQVPYNVNMVISGQISLLDLARAVAAPCNAVAGVSMLGKLFTSRVVLGDAMLTLDAQGRQMPPVLGAARQTVRPPYKRIKMGAAQCWRVHTFDEIAFYADLIAKGAYDPGTVYREGNIVTTSDSARWVYINETPGSGNAPPVWPTTSNAYWSNLDAPLTAENITYADGTPIEDLRPAEVNADVTAANQITFKPITPVAVQADAGGDTTTELPIERTIVLQRGGVDLTTGVTYAVLSATAGITAAITGGNVLELDPVNAAGQVVVRATYGGNTYDFAIPVSRTQAGAPIGGTSGSTQFVDSVLTNVTSTTEAKVTDEGVVVRSDSNGDLRFTLSAVYQGSGTMAATPKYSSDNSSWTAVGSENTGSAATGGAEPEPGFISFSVDETGLTADTDYYVALFARRTASTGTLSWLSATFTVKQIA